MPLRVRAFAEMSALPSPGLVTQQTTVVQAYPMSESEALPLDGPRWGELQTRRGEGADWVSRALLGLREGAPDARAFGELWPELCSEETTYEAAYAAAPYLAEMAARGPLSESMEYLIVLGLLTTYATNRARRPGSRIPAGDGCRAHTHPAGARRMHNGRRTPLPAGGGGCLSGPDRSRVGTSEPGCDPRALPSMWRTRLPV
jgi:hypothetical protein